jgi:hypothetical protein
MPVWMVVCERVAFAVHRKHVDVTGRIVSILRVETTLGIRLQRRRQWLQAPTADGVPHAADDWQMRQRERALRSVG